MIISMMTQEEFLSAIDELIAKKELPKMRLGVGYPTLLTIEEKE